MWSYLYVVCPAEPSRIRKVPIFVYEDKIYAINICDFGNGSKICDSCISKAYSLLKENPELLRNVYTPDNPFRLGLD